MFILKCCSTVSAAAFALRRWPPDVRGRPLSLEFQSENYDLMEVHVQARTLATSFLEIRENAEEAFDGLFNRACTIANKNEITINKPRTSGGQRRRANAAAETVEQHFRINIVIPLIDHITKHLNDRFPDNNKRQRS
jgi:hypothetical protein